MQGKRNKTAARRGYALLVVLLIIMAIAVLSMGFLARSDVELACGQNMIIKTQMDYLAESALEHAKGLILNPQDVASEYWTGAARQQLFAGSNDYYDVSVTKLGELNYQITSTAYREKGGEQVGRSSLKANLRLDPAIGFWSGSAVSFYPNTSVTGDVYCNGVLVNKGILNGDCFADSLTGNPPSGAVKPKAALQLVRPAIDCNILTSNFSTQTISSNNLNSTTLSGTSYVYYKNGNLEIKKSVIINGCLAVDGDLTISDTGNVITSKKNVPAIYVSGNLILKASAAITITGLVFVDGRVKTSLVNQSMSVTGALFADEGIQCDMALPDYSGNGYDGVVNGDCNFIPGFFGDAVKFDGNSDYVNINHISEGALLLPGRYTVSLWFRADGGAGGHRDLFSATDANLQHGLLLELRDNGVLRYVHRNPFNPCGTGDSENIYTTTTYDDGLWHHVAAVRASDNSRLLYVDGQQVGSDSNVTTAFDAPVSVILGALFSPGYPSGGRFWNGAIDDVRIYNRALSATEVAELYTGSETSNWPHYEDVNSIYKFYEPEKEQIVADDWRCLRRTPVTAVVWWGSYIGYGYEACQGPMPRPVRPDKFRLMMWTDVAADPCDPCSYSHPGEVIWQYDANKYDEVLVGYDKHPEGEPNEPVFRYSVRLPEDKWFHQPAYNEVFWLSVQAVYDINMPDYAWGWTNHKHLFNDDAVAGYRNPTGGEWVWEELYDQTDASEDMSFMLFTDPALCSTCANYNCDARVNFVDFADFADDWRWVGPAGGYNNSDLDCNGVVDFKDVGIFCLQWLEYCP